jgi:hypothetical protein
MQLSHGYKEKVDSIEERLPQACKQHNDKPNSAHLQTLYTFRRVLPLKISAKTQPMFSATSKGRRAGTTCDTHSALAPSSDSSVDNPVTQFGEL